MPLTIGIVLVLLALTLAVGWSVLVVRGIGDVQQVAERLSNTHWILLSLGSLLYALLIAGLTLLCAWLVREMRHSQRAALTAHGIQPAATNTYGQGLASQFQFCDAITAAAVASNNSGTWAHGGAIR